MRASDGTLFGVATGIEPVQPVATPQPGVEAPGYIRRETPRPASGGAAPLVTFDHAADVAALAFLPDGRRLVTGAADLVELWEVDGQRKVHQLQHPGTVRGLAVTADGSILAVAGGRGVVVWDLRTFAQVQRHEFAENANDVSFSPDGGHLAVACFGRLHLLSTKSWSVVAHDAEGTWMGWSLNAVDFSPDGMHAAAASTSKFVTVWGLPSLTRLRRMNHGGGNYAHAVAFSPAWPNIASGGSDGARHWNAGTGMLIRRFEGKTVWSLAFDPEGRLLALGREDRLQIVDVTTGQYLGDEPVRSRVRSIAFRPGRPPAALELAYTSGRAVLLARSAR